MQSYYKSAKGAARTAIEPATGFAPHSVLRVHLKRAKGAARTAIEPATGFALHSVLRVFLSSAKGAARIGKRTRNRPRAGLRCSRLPQKPSAPVGDVVLTIGDILKNETGAQLQLTRPSIAGGGWREQGLTEARDRRGPRSVDADTVVAEMAIGALGHVEAFSHQGELAAIAEPDHLLKPQVESEEIGLTEGV